MTNTIKNPRILTDDQRAFASKMHDEVVYGFLNKRKLNRDQYYDVVIFKYLYAVQIYLNRPELQKYTFKTVAYRAMNNALYSYWRKMARPKYTTQVLSLSSMYDGSLEEQMGLQQFPALYEGCEAADDWKEVMQSLTPMELQMLQKKVEGYTYRELAEEAGLSYTCVASRFHRIRQKARASLATATA